MTLLDQIEQKLIAGMDESCSDTILFLEDDSQLIATEYLFTVNAAKKLAELNSGIGYPYKIYLEKKTKSVAKSCVPLMKRVPDKNRKGGKSIISGKHNTSRNGYVDICLYKDSTGFSETPVCIIELKGFNPRRGLVVKDLERNLEFFEISDKTGSSLLQHACFAAMHSFPKTIVEEQTKKDRALLHKKYENWLSNLSLPQGVTHRLLIKTISFGLNISMLDEDDQNSQTIDSNHHFVGVVVSFTRES